MSLPSPRKNFDYWFPLSLVLFNSIVIFYWFLPEILHSSLSYNDGVLHISMVRRMNTVWERGGDILDFWSRNIASGHALLRASHFLFYFFTWVLHRATASFMSIEQSFYLSVVLMLTLLPWALYSGARLLGFSRMESALVGWLISITGDVAGLGMGLFNYTFTGHGLYNQAFGQFSLLISIGLIRRALAGRGYLTLAAGSYAITWMSHIFIGYMVFVWSFVDALILAVAQPGNRRKIAGRWLSLQVLFGIFASGSLVSIFQDRLLQHKSPFEPPYRWVGHGARYILKEFSSGNLLDAGAWIPAITLFSLIGWGVCLFSLRKKGALEQFRSGGLALLTLFWVAFTFGPATWGQSLYWVPFSKHIQWDRFAIAMAMALILCASIGVSTVFRYGLVLFGEKKRLWVALLLGALFLPNLKASHNALAKHNAGIVLESEAAWNQDRDARAILDFARNHWDARYDPGNFSDYGARMSVGRFTVASILNEFNVDSISHLYHAMGQSSVLNYAADWTDARDAQLLNIRYVVLPNDIRPLKGFKTILSGERFSLYDNGNDEGYFMIGTLGAAGCADNDSLFRSIQQWLEGPLFREKVFPVVRLADRCLKSEPKLEAIVARPQAGTASGKILDAGVGPGPESRRHWAKVRMDAPGIVLFKMSYHPFWHISANGVLAPTTMVIPGYMAVSLGKGVFDVEARYVSLGWRRLLLGFGLLSAIFLILGEYYFRRRRACP